MELIYLWVKEYKNIKNQGFNFSSRFKCKFYDKYDEKGNLKDNCRLVICDKKNKECLDEENKKCKFRENTNYIDNFFGDNINITAIVGKNGSGKSSLLNSIIYIYGFIIYKKDDKYYIYLNNILDKETKYNFIRNDPSLKFLHIIWRPKLSNLFAILHYDYSLTNTKFNNMENNNIYSVPIKIGNDIYQLNSQNEIKNMFLFIDDINRHSKFFNNYYEPVKSILSYKEIDIGINTAYREYRDDLTRLSSEAINKNNFNKFEIIAVLGYFCQVLMSFGDSDKEFTPHNEYKNPTNSKKYVVDPLMRKEIKNIIEDINGDKIKDLINYFNTKSNKILENHFHLKVDRKNLNSYDQHKKRILDYLKIENRSDFIKKRYNFFKKNKTSFLLNTEKIKEDNEFLSKILPCFQIDFIDKFNKKYSELSNGEQSLLRIRSYIEWIILKNDSKDDFVLLFDEASNELHPQWQKKLLKYLIEVFKNRKQNFHFIFTTHSSFLISDLPKQNIIFLASFLSCISDFLLFKNFITLFILSLANSPISPSSIKKLSLSRV